MQAAKPNTVIAVVGPTCSGKTALSIKLAKALGGEIIACDSRTIYRYMDIGTAKPALAERQGVPHYMFDVSDPDQPYTVADYKEQAASAMNDMFARFKLPIVCGGTGFYARALLEGLVMPSVPPQEQLRESLKQEAEQFGNQHLHDKLAQLDPVSAQKLNANDRFRVIRALEVSIVCGQPFSQLTTKIKMPFNVIWIGLTAADREFLRNRIQHRFAEQMEAGLLTEVQDLFKRFGACRTLLNTVNYSEFIPYMDGEISLPAAQESCLKNNNQLVRRQLIWFRANSEINWFEIDRLDDNSLFNAVHSHILHKLAE